jgi:hypothetical protein
VRLNNNEYVVAEKIFRHLIFDLGYDMGIVESIFLSDKIVLGPQINGKITIKLDELNKLLSQHNEKEKN